MERSRPPRSDAVDDAVGAGVVRGRLPGGGLEGVAEVDRQGVGRRHDGAVVRDRAHHRHRCVDGEPGPTRRAAIGVDRHRHIGMERVGDGGADIDTGAHAGVGGTGEHDPGPVGLEESLGPQGHVEVEGVLGVAVVGLGAGGVTRFDEPTPVDGPVDGRRGAAVAPVVAGVDHHRQPRQRGHRHRSLVDGRRRARRHPRRRRRASTHRRRPSESSPPRPGRGRAHRWIPRRVLGRRRCRRRRPPASSRRWRGRRPCPPPVG